MLDIDRPCAVPKRQRWEANRPFAIVGATPSAREISQQIAPRAGHATNPAHVPSCSSSAPASFRSSVSNPSVNQPRPEREVRVLHPACPDRARAARCSWRRAVPRIYCSAAGRLGDVDCLTKRTSASALAPGLSAISNSFESEQLWVHKPRPFSPSQF